MMTPEYPKHRRPHGFDHECGQGRAMPVGDSGDAYYCEGCGRWVRDRNGPISVPDVVGDFKRYMATLRTFRDGLV